MRVFTSDDFTGMWPVGTVAVVVANNEAEALTLITKACEKHGLKFDGTLKELSPEPAAYILRDGDY